MECPSTSSAFLEQLSLLTAEKTNNKKSLSLAQYNENVALLQAAIVPGKKSSKQHSLIRDFMLVPGINNEMKLAKKRKHEDDNFLYVIPK